MTIQDTHTHTLTHRENFSDGLTRLEAYVISLPVITQLIGSHPLTNYTMMYALFLVPIPSSCLPFFHSSLPVIPFFLLPQPQQKKQKRDGANSSERENQPEEDPSVAARLHRLSDHYNSTGVRRGVEAVMVVMVSLPFPHSTDFDILSTRSRYSSFNLTSSLVSVFV